MDGRGLAFAFRFGAYAPTSRSRTIMRLVNYVEIAPIALAGGWLLWGMIELFVYDEFGFRFSRKRQQRIDDDWHALHDLVKQLAPRVLAIRHQSEQQIEGAAYSFRKNSRDGGLELDTVEIISRHARTPIAAASLPAECAPLLRSLNSQDLKQAFARFAKNRYSLKTTHQIVVKADGVSLVKRGFTLLHDIVLTISVNDKSGQTKPQRTKAT